jgi:CRP-like cAMP-binding protein
MDKTAAATQLSKVPMFAGLSAEVLDALAEHAEEREFNPGDKLATRGEPNDGLLVLVDGEAEVYRGDRLFNVLGAGDYVGDMSLLDGEAHSVDVTATEPGYGVFLAGYQFQVVVKHHPEVAMEIIKVLVARIRETIGWLEEADQTSQPELP